MFQLTSRWLELVFHAGHRIKNNYDFIGVVQDLQALELLVRDEYQTVELELLIEQASDAFGCTMEDFLHE